jgi:lambda repressor-like predicted transcriptional regulator
MKYPFDTIVIELQKEGKSLGSISIKSESLATLENLHGHDFKTIIADMAETLKNEIDEREATNNK